MHGNPLQLQVRIERFLAERLLPAVYGPRLPLDVTVWHCPGEPVPFAAAVRQDYAPIDAGSAWGPPWGTSWFHVAGAPRETARSAPAAELESAGRFPEVLLDLGFTPDRTDHQPEGLVYSAGGRILKALESVNNYVRLPQPPAAVDLYVEAAANPNILNGFTFAPTPLGALATAGQAPLFTFRGAWLADRHAEAWELLQDIRTVFGLARELPAGSRQAQLLFALSRMLDAVDPGNVAESAAAGRAALAEVLAAPASVGAHRIHAVGHAHIDSAWLWPVRETVRKVARTFANVLDLMEQDPQLVFAASSAQQYAWLRDGYPELFARVKAAVRAGRFVPAGGMWVEADTNLPGGEALVRQFLLGKKFFRAEFGVEPQDVWLPDSFGYSAALPQIARAAGSRWFLTQKLCWNDTNVMPHSSFLWEGIDGTRIFTHFPPVGTYSSELTAAELARSERLFADAGPADTSLVPFGWGDGGGGPTREMLAAAHRAADLDGSPRVRLSGPAEFFDAAESEYADPPVWLGELYLEFHRGTYTSQARMKSGNRRTEHLLREAELWATAADLSGAAGYPYERLERCWQRTLLQQFHDILPGSAISWVHREAERVYADLAVELRELIQASLRAVLGSGPHSVAVNAGPYAVEGVPALGGTADPSPAGPEPAPATVTAADGGWLLDNGVLRVAVDADGLVPSVRDRETGRELIPDGTRANLLQLFRDTPATWDAWNIDADYVAGGTDLRAVDSIEVVPAAVPAVVPAAVPAAALRISRSFGASRVVQLLSLGPGARALDIETTVDWHEQQKLLKLAFPLDIAADRAASEIQFGHIHRPTHSNTSWDAARFETAAHRWVHVGEPGFGAAVANDSTYGHDIRRAAAPGGTPYTLVRLSLLRAPLYPDPGADQGSHTFRTALAVGAGIPAAVSAGYRLNLPLRRVDGAARDRLEPLLTVDSPAVVVEAVKLAEDRSGDVIVRLYEAFGGRATARLTPAFGFAGVTAVDLLERPVDAAGTGAGAAGPVPGAGVLDVPAPGESGGTVTLRLRPFQLVSLRFRRPAVRRSGVRRPAVRRTAR